MQAVVKKGLLIFVFAVLFLPLFQQCFLLIESAPLHGAFINSGDVVFAFDKWEDGSYQHQKESYLNDNTGLRPDLVRMNNQLDYSLFGKVHADWVVLGKSHCLFQSPYINSYYGRDYVGRDTIAEKIRKLKALQDTFAHMGKSLILIQSPDKAYYFPEYIPDDMKSPARGPTNYEGYVHAADSAGINQIDFNSWFVSMKDKSKEMLYSKQGIHWTVYGSVLAGDSIVRYIERLRKIRMPHPRIDSIYHDHRARETDDDIARLLNLALPVTTENFSYPEYSYVADSANRKPKIIMVGDSFGWNFMSNGMLQNTSTEWEFWYYFREVYNHNYLEHGVNAAMKDWDWRHSMNEAECIIVMYTSHNLSELGNGFIEQAYDFYYPEKKVNDL